MQIDDLRTWPQTASRGLHDPTVRHILENADSVEDLMKCHEILRIGEALIQNALESGLVGFHCTKEPTDGYFQSAGLDTTSPSHSIKRFLTQYGRLFSENTLNRIRKKLGQWQEEQNHMEARANKIWFCLTAHLVLNQGTDRFFTYYGGEIIYCPFLDEDSEVLEVLAAIGRPVVIEAYLDLSQLEFCGEQNLLKSFLSYCKRSVNPGFRAHDIEGYCEQPIPPDKIARVWDRSDFFVQHCEP